MIKSRAVMFLDGRFKNQPEHTVHTHRDEKGTWFITRAGPKYRNVSEVVEFDVAGELALKALEKVEEASNG